MAKKQITPNGISIILANPYPDPRREVTVQVLDMRRLLFDRYLLTVSDGKDTLKAALDPSLTDGIMSGEMKSLGLMRLTDYSLDEDYPDVKEKYLIIKNFVCVSSPLVEEINIGLKAPDRVTKNGVSLSYLIVSDTKKSEIVLQILMVNSESWVTLTDWSENLLATFSSMTYPNVQNIKTFDLLSITDFDLQYYQGTDEMYMIVKRFEVLSQHGKEKIMEALPPKSQQTTQDTSIVMTDKELSSDGISRILSNPNPESSSSIQIILQALDIRVVHKRFLLTVTDGTYRLNSVMASNLNNAIMCGDIQNSSLFCITSYSVEAADEGHKYLLVKNFVPVTHPTEDSPFPK